MLLKTYLTAIFGHLSNTICQILFDKAMVKWLYVIIMCSIFTDIIFVEMTIGKAKVWINLTFSVI